MVVWDFESRRGEGERREQKETAVRRKKRRAGRAPTSNPPIPALDYNFTFFVPII
jgi:hypothetical protein